MAQEISQDKINKLQEIIANNRRLCSPEGMSKINSSAKDMKFDSEFNRISESPNTNNYTEPVYNEETVKNSKLPEAIKESMINHIIRPKSDNILDSLTEGISTKQERPTVNETPKEVIKETYTPQNIDYNYIKYIVTECISDYFKKQPLNESNGLSKISLSNGKIKLVDNKGNVFSAQLVFEGNIKDKKQK